jgi:biopolymer transport protein ExbD
MIARLFAVLVVSLTLGLSAAFADPPAVVFRITKDGTFTIDGQTYPDGAALKAKIDELSAERPQPVFVLSADKSLGMSQIALMKRAMTILQNAGIGKFGVLLDERN